MNKLLRSGILLLPVLFLLIALSIFSLSGCTERPGEPPINEDTVRHHVIPIKLAAELTSNFRSTIDSFKQKCPQFKDSLQFGRAESFDRDVFRKLLEQTDTAGNLSAGIRIYFGRDSAGKIKFVMVPYDKNGNDILKKLATGEEKQVPGVSPAKTRTLSLSTSDAEAMETGQVCPPSCSPSSPLNP